MECNELYGCETWTVKRNRGKNIRSTRETWRYRYLVDISWCDKLTNGANGVIVILANLKKNLKI